MDENDTPKKKTGPIPGVATVRTNVLVEPELLEWAKRRPGGFSETVRRLLRDAKDNDDVKGNDTKKN